MGLAPAMMIRTEAVILRMIPRKMFEGKISSS